MGLFDIFKKKKKKEVDADFIVVKETNKTYSEKSPELDKKYGYDGYNRADIDSAAAKIKAKAEAFKSGKPVKDPYTNKTIYKTQAEAKAHYGADYQRHVAESDHTVPLKQISEKYQDTSFISKQDIKEIANSEDNIKVIARDVNNYKRAKTNEETVRDSEGLKAKGIKIPAKGREKAIEDQHKAETNIEVKVRIRQAQNALNEFHSAGLDASIATAQQAAIYSAVDMLPRLLNHEITVGEFTKEVAKKATKSSARSYALSGSKTVLNQHLLSYKNPMVKGLVKNGVPNHIIDGALTFGSACMDYARGRIDHNEFVLQIGDRGVNMLSATYTAALGQALIPIPVVGAVIGGYIGAMISSAMSDKLFSVVRKNEAAHNQRMAILKEAEEYRRQAEAYKLQLASLIDDYITEHRELFTEALTDISSAFSQGDVDGVIAGANKITRQMHGEVKFNNKQEFRDFLDNDEKDVF